MSNFSDAATRVNSACLSTFGEPITYITNAGGHVEISTSCILRPPEIDGSSSPGYFADIEVDPAVITAPQRKDIVIWADETVYVVSKVVQPAYGMPILALHRKDDK